MGLRFRNVKICWKVYLIRDRRSLLLWVQVLGMALEAAQQLLAEATSQMSSYRTHHRKRPEHKPIH